MPYGGEYASGESLIWLENSKAYQEFEGTVLTQPRGELDPNILEVDRREWTPSRVIAIDGSNISHRVRNGFPGAEASLILVSAVRIDLSQLTSVPKGKIPSPKVFRDMEQAETVQAVLPGANIVRKSVYYDSPRRYFRSQVYETLARGAISSEHETLLGTLQAMTPDRESVRRCPIEGCDREVSLPSGCGEKACPCGEFPLWETDALRLDERFNELGSNGEVHGEFRGLVEVLVLVNILRFFPIKNYTDYLSSAVFVLDGPLALFGHTAWLTPYIKKELCRINELVKNKSGEEILVLGIEKGGRFFEHFQDLDFDNNEGPKGRFDPSTVIAPTSRYINRNIVFRPDDSKPHGQDTYFGRKILYKTKNSDHAIVNLGIVNASSDDLNRADLDCYPRISDALDIMDHLSTYLYDDGFMPLIRAHAHAAIPLQKGTDILSRLFNGESA